MGLPQADADHHADNRRQAVDRLHLRRREQRGGLLRRSGDDPDLVGGGERERVDQGAESCSGPSSARRRANDELRVEGDNRFQWTSQDTFGLGTSTEPTDDVNARFTYLRVYETVLFDLGKGLLGGVGVHYSTHSDIRPGDDAAAGWEQSPFVEYSLQHGFDLQSQTSAGFGLNLVYDTRDHPINASRGWLASMSFRPYFKDVLGSDSVWQEVVLDVRTFTKVSRDARQKLAFWVYGDFVVDGVAPYFALPALGTDTYGRTGRGYVEGRFRGERLLYGEVEYRATLTRNGLLGMVAFANTATVTSLETGERLFDAYAPAAGFGLRVLFNKRSKTNLCVDYAWGNHGLRGLYLALLEAFWDTSAAGLLLRLPVPWPDVGGAEPPRLPARGGLRPLRARAEAAGGGAERLFLLLCYMEVVGLPNPAAFYLLEVYPHLLDQFHLWHRRMGMDRSPLGSLPCC